MDENKFVNISIKNLRLWDKNPRYDETSKISLNDLGDNDFIKYDGYIIKDQYESNYKKYFKRLLNNIDSIKITFDLIESLSAGYDSSLDDIFIVKPKNLYSYLDINNPLSNDIKNIYYVIEGNRRLLCIDLLKKYHNSRLILLEIINDLEKDKSPKTNKTMIKLLKNILNICKTFDQNEKIPSFIKCKVLSFEYYMTSEGIKELNKMLNARHFGNRKGKLNWPRGLILKKIFQLVKYEFKKNPSISTKDLCKNIEDYVGKKITTADINSALFVNKALDTWNKFNPDNIIKWSETETGDIGESNNIIIYDETGEEISSTEESVTIFVSSLELSKSNIKLLDKDFNKTTLSKILFFEYSYIELINDGEYLKAYLKNGNKKEYLDKETLELILVEIVRAVKDREINTRSFGNDKILNVGRELRKLLFPNEIIPVKEILNFSIEQIYSINNLDETSEDNKLINDISHNITKLINSYEKSKKKFTESFDRNKDNTYMLVLAYIWKTEYGRLLKFKDNTTLKNIPTLIFSSLYRTTYEFTLHMLSYNFYLDYLKLIQQNEFEFIPNTIYEKTIEKLWDKMNSLLSDSKKSPVFFKINGKPILDFEENFRKESKENQIKIINDFSIFFYAMLGIDNFSPNSFENFSYFDKVNINELLDKTSNLKYNGASFFRIGLSSEELTSLVEKIKENNSFNMINEEKKVNYMVNMMKDMIGEDKTLSSNSEVLKMINRAIHRPLSVVYTYNDPTDLEKLNLFLLTLEEVENLIIKIIE